MEGVEADGESRGVTIGISLGYFMVLLDMTVLAVAEPDLAATLHASVAGLQWITTGYTVAFGALLLSGGALADRYGAHRTFRLGVTAFGGLSLLSAAAPTVPVLVALRVLLGVAAAACVPASLALIARLNPDPAQRTRAVGTWAAISGAAVAIGPVAGGLLVDLAGWRAVFVINVPITLVVLALTANAHLKSPTGDRRITWPAQLTLGAAVAAFTDAVIAAGSRSWPHAALSAALTVLTTLFFRRLDRRADLEQRQNVLPRIPGISGGLTAGAAVNFALNGSLFVLPLMFQHAYALGASATGLALLPLTVPFVLGPPVTSRLVSRFGPRPPVLAGLSLLTAASLTLAAAAWSRADHPMPAAWSQGAYPLLAAALLAFGCGVALVLPSVVAAVLAAAPPGSAGAAGGLLNAVRQLGATIGVATMGALLHAGTPTALLLPALACTAAALYFRASGSPRRRTRSSSSINPK